MLNTLNIVKMIYFVKTTHIINKISIVNMVAMVYMVDTISWWRKYKVKRLKI